MSESEILRDLDELELRPERVFNAMPGLDLPVPRYRVGRRNGHTIYLMKSSEPSDEDIFVGACVNPSAAWQLVAYANLGLKERWHELP